MSKYKYIYRPTERYLFNEDNNTFYSDIPFPRSYGQALYYAHRKRMHKGRMDFTMYSHKIHTALSNTSFVPTRYADPQFNFKAVWNIVTRKKVVRRTVHTDITSFLLQKLK